MGNIDTFSPVGTVMIVDDTPANIGVLFESLSSVGYKVLVANSGERGLEKIRQEFPDIILLDVMMPGMDGFEVCSALKEDESTKDIPVVFMTSLTETENKVRAFDAGAVDYVTKPFQTAEVRARVATHMRIRRLQEELETEVECRTRAEKQLMVANADLEERVSERTRDLKEALTEVEKLKDRLEGQVTHLSEEIARESNFREMIGGSPALKEVQRKIEMVAKTDATVLITGESGTGKELVARAIHAESDLRDGPLIKVNCGAIPENLVESELFGHIKGSFTGAVKDRLGRFELANGGTLFLDEIGELTLDVQVKLLRVLQEGEFERLGGTDTVKVDVRIICATHRDLLAMIEKGTLREDLYYRLNVFPIENPSLRRRKMDIPLLADFFLKKFSAKFGKNVNGFSSAVASHIIDHKWPGNVRELQNAVERAVILAQEETIDFTDFIDQRMAKTGDAPSSLDELDAFEREIYLKALKMANWKIGGAEGAASLLDRPVSTVRDRVKKLGLDREV